MVDEKIYKISRGYNSSGYNIRVNSFEKRLTDKCKKAIILCADDFTDGFDLDALLLQIAKRSKKCPIIIVSSPHFDQEAKFDSAVILSRGSLGLVTKSVAGACKLSVIARSGCTVDRKYMDALSETIATLGIDATVDCEAASITLTYYSQDRLEESVLQITEKTKLLDDASGCFTMIEVPYLVEPVYPSLKICEFLLAKGIPLTSNDGRKNFPSNYARNQAIIMIDDVKNLPKAIISFMEEF